MSQASLGKGGRDVSEPVCAQLACIDCGRPAVYRVKTVGGEFEVVCCGRHLTKAIQDGLSRSVAQQGVRVQVTRA